MRRDASHVLSAHASGNELVGMSGRVDDTFMSRVLSTRPDPPQQHFKRDL